MDEICGSGGRLGLLVNSCIRELYRKGMGGDNSLVEMMSDEWMVFACGNGVGVA